jgi:hypothetical protein
MSRPSALAKGAVLTKASPVLQFERTALPDFTQASALVASVARPADGDVLALPIPVIKRIVRHSIVDPEELAPRGSRPPPAHRYGAIVLAAVFAAALGALAGISMRAITPAAAPQAAAAHVPGPPELAR